MGDPFSDDGWESPYLPRAVRFPRHFEDANNLPSLVSGKSGREGEIQSMLRLPKWPFKFDFFVSYTAREQGPAIKSYVVWFVRQLREMGYSVFWLDEVEIGKFEGTGVALKKALSRGMDQSLAAILFTSPQYWESEYCRFEFERALLTSPRSDGASTVPFVGAMNWLGDFPRENLLLCNERWEAVAAAASEPHLLPHFFSPSHESAFRQDRSDEYCLNWLWRLLYPVVELPSMSGEYLQELEAYLKELKAMEKLLRPPSDRFVDASKIVFSRVLSLLAHAKRRRWARWRSIMASRFSLVGPNGR